MTETITAGGALLARLKAVGVDYIFANSGTDFPPIIEGLAEAAAKDIPLPQAVVIPHEHAAMGMAHGYYLGSGRPQAVMAHTNVGLANCAIGAINAATEHVPVLLFSGRTPTVEQGRFGARTVPIGWGQEMRDQAALVREAVKWDYELRFPEQVPAIVDRAYAIAASTPRGPVYVSLPREILCEPCPTDALGAPPTMVPVDIAPSAPALSRAAALLAGAERPLIIAQRGAGSALGFAELATLATEWAIPVCQYWAVQLAIATDHAMHVGIDPGPLLAEADVVLVLDSLAPWSPAIHAPPPECTIIQAGPDPLYARFPVRNFRCDLALAGDTADLIVVLRQAMQPQLAERAPTISARRDRIAPMARATRAHAVDQARAGGTGERMTKAWVSHCLSAAIAGHTVSILSELGCPLEPMALRQADSWFQEPHSGGLGWSFPTALGLQLAQPGRLVIATMGDGSYIFANPVTCHQIAEAMHLPILVLVLNNREWGAVRQSVTGMYPDGHAVRANTMPLTSLEPTPDFAMIARASRAWATSVGDPAELPATLEAAIKHVTTMRTQALIEIAVSS